MPTAAMLVIVFSFSEVDFKVRDVLHSDSVDMPGNDSTHAFLIVNVPLIYEPRTLNRYGRKAERHYITLGFV